MTRTNLQDRGKRTLWSLTSGQRSRYAAAIGAMGVGSVFLLLVPYILKVTLDSLADGRATLYETLLDALAAEHGARLVSTESAGEWLETKIGETNRALAAVRDRLREQ